MGDNLCSKGLFTMGLSVIRSFEQKPSPKIFSNTLAPLRSNQSVHVCVECVRGVSCEIPVCTLCALHMCVVGRRVQCVHVCGVCTHNTHNIHHNAYTLGNHTGVITLVDRIRAPRMHTYSHTTHSTQHTRATHTHPTHTRRTHTTHTHDTHRIGCRVDPQSLHAVAHEHGHPLLRVLHCVLVHP